MSMIVMLAVLAMLIARSADPNMWKWFTGEGRIADAGAGDGEDAAADQAKAKKVVVQQPPEPEKVTPIQERGRLHDPCSLRVAPT